MKGIVILMLLSLGLLLNSNVAAAMSQGKVLVAYFSRIGNEYSVGKITKGNTAIIADIIAKETNADLFEIKPAKPYPSDYDECTKIASKEKAVKARPEIVGKVENLQEYDIIFIGYPIWWGDMPMAVYTFLESYDFSGKKIVPFCTHGGSGLSSTDQAITLACPNSKILQGFAIRGAVAQNKTNEAKATVQKWLSSIDL
ncbi:MAG: flavodoxin [Selenomonadaceae bacterium]|nr:flavodoxin [Selenomonadaceae bacterium]